MKYEKEEKEALERQEHQLHHHLDVLKSIRGKLEDRAELRSRTFEFREWQKEFSKKKHAVLSGKTLADFSRDSVSNDINEENVLSSRSAGNTAKTGQRTNKSSELSTVLKSLDKLNELEKRITSLETDNAYERMMQAEAPVAQEKGKDRLSLEFRQKVMLCLLCTVTFDIFNAISIGER